MDYFSDQAVLLPVALFLLLEVLLSAATTPRARLTFDLLQALVIFCGVMTDWFFVSVLVLAFVKRYALGELGTRPRLRAILARGCAFSAPAWLAIGLFLWQIIATGYMPYLLKSYLLRSGAHAADAQQQALQQFNHITWAQRAQTFAFYYGKMAAALLLLSLLLLLLATGILLWRKRAGKPWHPALPPAARLCPAGTPSLPAA